MLRPYGRVDPVLRAHDPDVGDKVFRPAAAPGRFPGGAGARDRSVRTTVTSNQALVAGATRSRIEALVDTT
jgi:hypothetical protein